MTAVPADARIALLVSDVDGTLVTDDKRLTDAVIAAAARLGKAGVRLSLVSSRPPMGFAALSGTLRLEAPLGAFNGGVIVDSALSVLEQVLVPEGDAAVALAAFAEFGLDAWLFSPERWFATNPNGALVPKERMTISADPVIVADFGALLGRVGKLVGSSHRHDSVAACEAALAERLGPDAVARRSQPYYLDVTPAGSDKGRAVRRIAEILRVPIDEVAVIGDMSNDLPMFEVAPFRIAMGNATDEVKRMADFVTTSNEASGFAQAVDRFILPRARTRTPA